MQVQSLGQKDPLEDGMATHSRILSWRISWTEEPGGLQSMGTQRAGHDRSDLACTHNCNKNSLQRIKLDPQGHKSFKMYFQISTLDFITE